MTDTIVPSTHEHDAALDRLVSRACRLYTLPGVAMQVLKLTSNPKVDTRALKECIETDPALTAKVLRVVNSSLFGLSRAVSDVTQALALLGIKPLKLLVLTFSLPHGLFAEVGAATLGWYWRHTLTKAVAAREIGRIAGSTSGDEAFTAALLQDLGVLLLLQELGQPYLDVLQKVIAEGGDLAAAEIEAMGFDHTELTARLLESWKLPPVLIEAVRGPGCGPGNTPVSNPVYDAGTETVASAASAVTRIVALAGRIARLMADNRAEVYPQIVAAARHWGLLPSEAVDPLLHDLESKVQQLADVLSLKLPEGVDATSLIVRAHGQLNEVAASVAEDLLRANRRGAAPLAVGSLGAAGRSLHEAMLRISGRPAEAPQEHIPGGEMGLFASIPTAQESVAATPRALPPIAVAAPPRGGPADRRGKTAGHAPATDPALGSRLAAAVAACRQNRCALSLMLAEVAQRDDLVMSLGVQRFEAVRAGLEQACCGLDHPQIVCLPYGELGFSVVLLDCERRQAVELGNALFDAFRQFSGDRSLRTSTALPLGVGTSTVSMPPKNFPPNDLLTAAERCLYGSHASGGGVVKSIEIY